MKLIKEKKALPLTFKYIEFLKNKNLIKSKSNLRFYVECEKYHTEYLVRARPNKSLTRLL